MNTKTTDSPNLNEAVTIDNQTSGLERIAQKMAVMKAQAQEQRNQLRAIKPTETGSPELAKTEETVDNTDNSVAVNPEVAKPETQDASSTDETSDPDVDTVEVETEVNPEDSSKSEIIDFLEIAEKDPDVKFKFVRNGKEIVIDAKKAASILGQGAAISEDARQLKIQKAEFDEYLKDRQSQAEGLLLAMEFTVKPQMQKAYDEILKTQSYQTTFKQQLAGASDPAAIAKIRASIQQNDRYIAAQSATITQLKPNVDQFYAIRQKQVADILETNRKGFKDKDLKNEFIYKETREKIAKGWTAADNQLVPGIKNIDLITADEHVLSLMRDGLKYREKTTQKSSGKSIAALTSGKTGGVSRQGGQSDVDALREKAKAGDKKAGQSLIETRLQQIRASRGR